MTEVWFLKYENQQGQRPIGLFTSKEVGMIAAKAWYNREILCCPHKKLLGVDDQEAEVHFSFGETGHAAPDITEYMVLERWMPNKALVDGEWKILADPVAEKADKDRWSSPEVDKFRKRKINDPWRAAAVAFFLGAGYDLDTSMRLAKELGY